MRWRQDAKTHKLVPIDEEARNDSRVYINGDIESFVSPIDGTVITDRKQYREHCRRHNVVPSAEFSPEYYAAKHKERQRILNGEHTREEKRARKIELYEAITRAERQ